jgi:hypothetical protein
LPRAAIAASGRLRSRCVTLAGDLKLLADSDRKLLAKEISDVKAVVTGLFKSVKASLDSEV